LQKGKFGFVFTEQLSVEELPKNIPKYYKESLQYWKKYKCNDNVQTKQFIWYNEYIKIDNRTVFDQSLFQAGLWTINDLYDNGILIPYDHWVSRGACKSKLLLWRGMINAIPKDMKTAIQTPQVLDIGSVKHKNVNFSTAIDEISQRELKSAIKLKELSTLNQNDFKAITKFENIHGTLSPNSWKAIFVLPHTLPVNNHIKDLQYKILHRIVSTNSRLAKMEILPSDKCNFCHMYKDTLEHSLWECYEIRNFWFGLFHIWNHIIESNIKPDLKTATFGIINGKEVNHKPTNTLFLFGKKYIFESKCNSHQLSYRNFTKFLKSIIYENHPDAEKFKHLIDRLEE